MNFSDEIILGAGWTGLLYAEQELKKGKKFIINRSR